MTFTSVDMLSRLTSAAVAAYGTLSFGPDPKFKAALVDVTNNVNFTSTQADTFVAQYQVLDQLPNVPYNGFSATVFLDKETGKHVIAMRGTETNTVAQALLDLLVTDGLSIGGNGFANNQAVEMIRYYKRVTTADDGAVNIYPINERSVTAGPNILLGSPQILGIKADAIGISNKRLLVSLCDAPNRLQIVAIGSAANEEVLICAA